MSRASRASQFRDEHSATELRDSAASDAPPPSASAADTGDDDHHDHHHHHHRLRMSEVAHSSRPGDAVPPASPQLHHPDAGIPGGEDEEADTAKLTSDQDGGSPLEDETKWVDPSDGVVYTYFVNPLISVCPFILIQELCERLAYYGMTPTLKPFLKHTLSIDDAHASQFIGWFNGIMFLWPVAGAVIADTWWGVYKTILIFSMVYAAGLGMIVLAAVESISHPWMVYVGLLFLICMGAGSIKSCVSVMGGHQFHPNSKGKLETYFMRFYMSINLGSLAGGIACPIVADQVSFFAAYLIPLSAFLIATTVFWSGRSRYVMFKPKGSPVIEVVKIIGAAICSGGCSFQPIRQSNGGDYDDAMVDDTIQLLKLQPVVSLTTFMMIAYNQMTTAFLTQGEKMASPFAPALMQNVDALSVIIASLLIEKGLFPYLKSIKKMPSMPARMAIGNAITILAMLAAFAVERKVMSQEKANTASIFMQVPQFTLVATAEIFTISTSYECAYAYAPHRLKAVSSACNLLYFSIAGFASGFFFVICKGWMPNFDAKQPWTWQTAHYDYYYLVLSGVCAIGVVVCLSLRGYFFREVKYRGIKKKKGSDSDDDDGDGDGEDDDAADDQKRKKKSKKKPEEAALLENC